MKRLQKALLPSLLMLAAVGCGEPLADSNPTPEVDVADAQQQEVSVSEGTRLFNKETFGGNGRTCATCHTSATGTLTVADLKSRASTDPIFKQIDSDARLGATYSKLLNNAVVSVDITLPPNVKIATDPLATKVTLWRGVPTTKDAPFFDNTLMWDARAGNSLQFQAMGAIAGHAQATRQPTADELASLEKYERTLFSSTALEKLAKGEATSAPLPTGVTDSEKRGAAFFAPTGRCGSCHGGPLLNQMTAFNPQGLPAGSMLSSAGVSEFNLGGNPIIPFLVTDPATGTVTPVNSTDPGLMLTTGVAAHAGVFKMTSLRNLKNTAPYFHDNSAKTIEAAMFQYKLLFQYLGAPLSDQDIADITAYMYLL